LFEKFKNKKICVLGFGVEGRATYEHLLAHGISTEILDGLNPAAFENKNPDIDTKITHLGDDYLSFLKDYEIVFKTPGISPFSPEIVKAKKAGVIFTSQIEEFMDSCPAKVIGVTGTKGKGTSSTLIYEIMKKSGFDAYLGGNIGIPAISFLDKLTSNSVVVLELSSFQLQVLKKSPNISVVLNITQDHLNYHETVEEYRDAKKNIVRFQGKNDYAVINIDYENSQKFATEILSEVRYFSRFISTNGCFVDNKGIILLNTSDGLVPILPVNKLLLRGRHNLENVTAAIEAAYLAGASVVSIKKTVESFKGLEHRLELVGEINGVKYYNDSFSTVPETAIAALDSFTEPIILIAGGSSKKSNYAELGKKIADCNVKAVILIGETAKEIASTIPKRFKGKIIFGLTRMTEIVENARKIAISGDVILLSPACASFGLFESYKDRGEQFKDAVARLV
jgi:UDP-N-acetylmuramoylalanine--D-glutamate ligase